MAWNTGNSYTITSPVNTALINGIGNDLRTWGGNVDAGGNSLLNCAGIGGLTGANPLILLANGAERMRIQSDGKMGIGLATPGQMLELAAGSICLARSTSGAGPWFVGLGDGNGHIGPGTYFGCGMGIAQDGSNHTTLNFFVSNGAVVAANAMTILPTGAVGIGTVAPTSPLQVIGFVTYASDAAAGLAGLTAGAVYKDSAGGLHVKL